MIDIKQNNIVFDENSESIEDIIENLVKIGKTGSENFEQRMYNLERNGYVNVVGLKRRFAIEVEDYDEKEILIHELF